MGELGGWVFVAARLAGGSAASASLQGCGRPRPLELDLSATGPSLPKAMRPWLCDHLRPSCLAGAPSSQGLRPRFCHRAGGQAGPASPLWPARVQGRLTGAVNGGSQELPSGCIRPTEPAATAAPASRCHCSPSGGPGAQDQAALCQP